MKQHIISAEFLSLEMIDKLVKSKTKLILSEESKVAVQKCRNYLDEKMKNSIVPVYGITTGFGSLCNTTISIDDLSTLQKNLVI